jgi:hypothetical protein
MRHFGATDIKIRDHTSDIQQLVRTKCEGDIRWTKMKNVIHFVSYIFNIVTTMALPQYNET